MINKKFNFSFGELLQRCDRVVVLIARDASQFESLGYEQGYKDSFVQKIAFFKTLQPDVYWQGQQILKTDEKSNARRELSNLLSEIRFRAKLALGEKSVKYASFRFSKLTQLDENQLIIFSWHVIKTAAPLLEELAIRRVDTETLGSINLAITALDIAIDEQKKAISTREEKVFERREAANELYEIMSECCEVGKRIWDGTNPAFYDDYLIYGSQTSINEEDVPEEDIPEEEPEVLGGAG